MSKTEERKYYVYRHRRADTHEPFYIGLGSSKYFKRAKTSDGRNEYWHRIVKKHGFYVEILAKNLTLEESEDLETLTISEYGRKNNGTGVLCNLADGGMGGYGHVCSQEQKDKLSLLKKGIPLSEEHVQNIKNNLIVYYGEAHPNYGGKINGRKIINITTGEIFMCMREASEFTGINERKLRAILTRNTKNNKTGLIYYKEENE